MQRQYCEACGMTTLHQAGACKVCVAKVAEQKRVERKLETLNTDAQRISFLLREFSTTKEVDADGRIRTVRDPGPARGRTPKNIARILRQGRERLAKAKVDGVDLAVLAPDSKIRKRVEASGSKRIKQSLRMEETTDETGRLIRKFYVSSPRGAAGREAARNSGKTTKRSDQRRAQAIELQRGDPALTHKQIAKIIEVSEKSVYRYLNGK
jgi:hypothetical protein